MRIFKKKEKGCCCGGNCTPETMQKNEEEKSEDGIKILGSGCAKCNALEANVKEALTQLQMDKAIEHITDFALIASYGVMTTPALVIDKKVVSYGKVLSVEEIKKVFDTKE